VLEVGSDLVAATQVEEEGQRVDVEKPASDDRQLNLVKESKHSN
jgi:hypothetical protein